MRPGQLYNKNLTLNHGNGTSPSGSPVSPSASVQTVQASNRNTNPHFPGEDDTGYVMTGAGQGQPAAGAGGLGAERYGWTASSGSRIEINDSDGGEEIELAHHSGAGFKVDPDGGVFVTSTSARGIGIASPRGDMFISSAGDVIINGTGTISIETSGDLNLTVGGTLNIVAGAIKTTCNTMETTVDGSASISVTNDFSEIIGGIKRSTVAGDSREQISGTKIVDVAGEFKTAVDGKTTLDVGADYARTVNGKTTESTKGDFEQTGGAKMSVHTGGDMELAAGGLWGGGGQAGAGLMSGGPVKLIGGSVHSNPPIDRSLFADEAAIAPPGPVGAPPPLQGGSLPARSSAGGASQAQTMEANEVVDTLTSARKYPEYPGNGVLESATKAGVGTIAHDETPQAQQVLDEYSGGNQGNANPTQVGGSYGTLPEQPVNRPDNIKVEDPGMATPSPHNNGAKISRYFTLGALTGAKHSDRIPASKWDSVVANHILVANNVLDRVKEQFPDMVITSAYRNSRPNHITGKAVDFVCESRSATRHAEMARFVRDNCPVDQVFLEKNTSGRSHVHVRVGSGKPKVMTCADPKCHSNTPGIDVEYLQRALRK